MSSNDEHAQSGDTIEITTHLRNDLGKRMQVSTADGLSVVALDNRMRVTVAHGDYRIVKRCGRPATADAPKKRGRPSNADRLEREKQLAAEVTRTPAAVEIAKPVVTAKPVVVTDADVAGLEAAIGKAQEPVEIDVPVTRKTVQDVMVKQKREALAHETEQTARIERDRENWLKAEGAAQARFEDACQTQQVTQEQIDAATEGLQPLYGVSQADFDKMTRQVEPRGFYRDDLPVDLDEISSRPQGILLAPRKHSHYFKDVPCNQIDVYRVLAAFGVVDPCIQHAVKKLLVAGGRGSKDISRDIGEAIDTLQRWQEMRAEEAQA